MLQIETFVFGPFMENTYLLWDDSGVAAVVDPGCSDRHEQAELDDFIAHKGLKLASVLNTHCHIDHIFGNDHLVRKYGIPLLAHPLEQMNLDRAILYAQMMGFNFTPSPQPDQWIEGGETIQVGGENLDILFVPGHCLGHVAFLHRPSRRLLAGDVLFQGSIGRTDLPGGNYETLMESIVNTVLPLGDDIQVYSGHGPLTSIGVERRTNPFILSYQNG